MNTKKRHHWESMGKAKASTDVQAVETVSRVSLLEMNNLVEKAQTQAKNALENDDDDPVPTQGVTFPIEGWWNEWLWTSSPLEVTTVNTPLNRSHLVGLLVARALPLMGASCNKPLGDLLPEASQRLCILDDPICDLNIKKLRDTVENIRSQWADQRGWDVPNIRQILAILLARLGSIVSMSCPSDDVVDDDEQLEPIHGQKQSNRVTRATIRRFLNIFMALFRSCHIHSVARDPDPETENCKGVQAIKKHHVFAGLDDFPMLSMHWDIPPAGVLNYMHDFPGMYNEVSQVVYFLNPLYKKRNPMSTEVEQISQGLLGPLFTLPSVIQMYPEIPVVQSDGDMNLLSKQGPGNRWLMIDRTIFLLTEDNTIYKHDNIVRLVHQLHFLLFKKDD